MDYTDVNGFLTRDGTTDANAVYALADDEYRLIGRSLSGWAIDVGAHIGTVSVALARQFPDLRVLAMEAVPDNSDLLERNIIRLGLGERITSVRAWAGRPGQLIGTCHYGYRHRDEESEGYVSAHRFVGNTWVDKGDPEFSIALPSLSLQDVMAQFAITEVDLLKSDCEGCEWGFLDTDLSAVRLITGEFHGGYPGHPDYHADPMGDIAALLAPTHDVTITKEDPCVGLFEGVRR